MRANDKFFGTLFHILGRLKFNSHIDKALGNMWIYVKTLQKLSFYSSKQFIFITKCTLDLYVHLGYFLISWKKIFSVSEVIIRTTWEGTINVLEESTFMISNIIPWKHLLLFFVYSIIFWKAIKKTNL